MSCLGCERRRAALKAVIDSVAAIAKERVIYVLGRAAVKSDSSPAENVGANAIVDSRNKSVKRDNE